MILPCWVAVSLFEPHSVLSRAPLATAAALLVVSIIVCTSRMYWAGSVGSCPLYLPATRVCAGRTVPGAAPDAGAPAGAVGATVAGAAVAGAAPGLAAGTAAGAAAGFFGAAGLAEAGAAGVVFWASAGVAAPASRASSPAKQANCFM